MSLLNKLGKMADKVQKKANELVDASARAAQHKVNSLRDNKELRDITVESKALPGVVQGFVRLLNAAGTKLEVFLRDYCGVPEAVAAQMTEIHNRLHAATVASTQHLTTFTLAMEEILKAEQAVDNAEKAVAQPPKPGQNPDELKAALESAKATAEQVRKKCIRDALTGFVSAQTDLFSAMISIGNEFLTIANGLPEQFPGQHIPYEALYDEPRPALGNSAAKPPPSTEKRKPHEELALLPRPVDGDTRAKYAKLWNEEIADVLEAHRMAMREADRWFALRLELAKRLVAWEESSPDYAAFKVTISCVPIFEQQFIEKHLPEFKKNFEAVYPGIERQVAPVPQKDIAPETPKPEIPKERNLVAKQAYVGAVRAYILFAERGKGEVAQFYQSAMGNLP